MNGIYIMSLASVIGYTILWMLKYLIFGSFVFSGYIINLFLFSILFENLKIDLLSGKETRTLRLIIMIISLIISFIIVKFIFLKLGVKVF